MCTNQNLLVFYPPPLLTCVYSTITAGDRLLFSARLKFLSGGAKTTCNIYTWDDSARCSDIFLYTAKNEVRHYIRVGQIITNDPDGNGW